MVALIDALKVAGEDDLADVRKRLAEIEDERQSLKQVERVLDLRLHGKAVKRRQKKNPEGQSAVVSASNAEKIYDVIVQNGAGTSESIGLKLGLTAQAVGVIAAKSGWFEKLDNGRWTIKTTKGTRSLD